MQFFATQGVREEEFLTLVRSPEIVEKASQARVMTVKYGLKGVPAMIVNGKYITASYYTRSLDEMLQVVDMLIRKERAELAAGSQASDKS
jgi:thiol:disulfide interchange protein DsbA